MGRARRGRAVATACVAAMAMVVMAIAAPGAPARAGAEPPVPGTGEPFPRVTYSPGDEPLLRDRLTRSPYRDVFLTMSQRADSFNGRPLGDMSVNAQRDLSRAAKVYAFQYALDRTAAGGAIVPFADAAARQARGERVEALLLNLFPRSRLAVAPPIGGWDRDISTAEEIANYAAAFDLLQGAGYDFGADRQTIVDLLAGATDELYRNFLDPATASNFTTLHQNNHRSKSGAAMAVAAVVLADDVPAAKDWFDFGVLQVDDVLRYMLVTGDGAYAEGPFYYRLTLQNLLPLLSTWDRFLGDGSWTVGDVEVPAMQHSALFERTARWLLDTTVPDGTMAPIDDGNPGRSLYFGALPSSLPTTAANYWRWADTPQPFETDGSVELGPDTIVAYDDGIAPAPPTWAPTQFYVEGGTATLRSDWSRDAVMALVLGEHDTASEFGRDRDGVGRWPQSHEHPDGGSFLLHAFGERLALDPGYLTFTTHGLVNKPQDHNMVLVDGQGPPDYLVASLNWQNDPLGRPPAEGQSTLHATLDGAGIDATSVATRYRGTEIGRRFLMADDRYLVIGDRVRGTGSSLTWMQHGNGGGTSGGTFTPTANGGEWQIGGARLDTGVSVAGRPVAFDTVTATHEVPYTVERTHTALRATVADGDADALQVLYPTRAGATPPTIADVGTAEAAGLALVDAGDDRRVLVRKVADRDGVQLVDEHLDGSPRLLYGDGVTSLDHGGATLLRSSTPGTLGVRLGAGQADVVAQTSDDGVLVGSLGFAPTSVDGACGLEATPAGPLVHLNQERRFTLRSSDGNARPAADAGADRRVAPGDVVTLDARASCDADGDALTARWQLVSAPAGSTWTLTGATTMQPQLHTDRVGPYRVRLVVTDAHGNESLEQEVVVVAGPRCGDGVDDDLDGLIDTDDADCDGIDPSTAGPTVSIGAASVVEGDSGKARTVQFPVTLSEPSTSPVTVDYTIAPDTATAGDVTPRTGTLTFRPSARTGLTPTTRFVTAAVAPDTEVEGDESFRATLADPSPGYTLGTASARGTILDDDGTEAGGEPVVSIGDACIVEGDTGRSSTATNVAKLRVTLDRPATETVTVLATISVGSATADTDVRTTKPKVVTFRPGQWQKTVAVPVRPDTDDEGIETAFVELTDPSTGLVLGRSRGVVLVVDDDD